MKTVRYFLAVVGFGVLSHELIFADQPSGQVSGQSSVQPSGDPTGQASGQKSQPASPSAQPSGKPIQQKPATSGSPSAVAQGNSGVPINNQSKNTPANMPSQPGLNQAATVTKNGLPVNRLETRQTTPAKLPSGSATMASIGGVSATSAKHTVAVINGTVMKRKF